MGILVNQNQIGGGASNSSHNIGDIFYTTRTDNSLNGAVECNGSQYNFSDFDSNLQALFDEGKLPYVSIGKFDSMVTNQGGCDSFGFDNKNLYCWGTGLTTYYTKSPTPKIGDKVYYSSGRPASFVLVSDISGLPNSIQIEGNGDRYTLTRNAENDILANFFKVPKKVGRVLVRTQKPTADNNYTWYNVYADGWCEQGGIKNVNSSGGTTVTLLVTMNNTNYIVTATANETTDLSSAKITVALKTTTTFKLNIDITRNVGWQVSGYAASSEYAQSTWEYQNVQVERPMVQLFNGATDEALATCTEVLADVAGLKQTTDGMIDYVIESQEPTEANGYTWYRLYKSGWVEQGGSVPVSGNKAQLTGTVELPIQMQTDKIAQPFAIYKYLSGQSYTIVTAYYNSSRTNVVATAQIIGSQSQSSGTLSVIASGYAV